jgi:16S rRNA (uracil1498-N3)-methyltransferase
VKNKTTKHHFALHVTQLPQQAVGATVQIDDKVVAHRVHRVMRLTPGDQVTLFDSKHACEGVLVENADKHKVVIKVIADVAHKVLTPAITFLLPVLKKEALERALYAAVELGAQHVYLVITEKIHRQWIGTRELERLHAVMIAAAEQSKQFVLPKLHAPKMLQELEATFVADAYKIHFDPEGLPLFDVLTHIHAQKPEQIILTCGPEGDFTPAEKQLLKDHSFVACKLTPTVLRAYQALVVGLGAVRSVASS